MFNQYRTHTVSLNRQVLKPVNVLNPLTETDVVEMISDGLESWSGLCKRYHAGLAIEVQEARRKESRAKKTPEAAKAEIYNAMPADQKTGSYGVIMDRVDRIYQARLGKASFIEAPKTEVDKIAESVETAEEFDAKMAELDDEDDTEDDE